MEDILGKPEKHPGSSLDPRLLTELDSLIQRSRVRVSAQDIKWSKPSDIIDSDKDCFKKQRRITTCT